MQFSGTSPIVIIRNISAEARGSRYPMKIQKSGIFWMQRNNWTWIGYNPTYIQMPEERMGKTSPQCLRMPLRFFPYNHVTTRLYVVWNFITTTDMAMWSHAVREPRVAIQNCESILVSPRMLTAQEKMTFGGIQSLVWQEKSRKMLVAHEAFSSQV